MPKPATDQVYGGGSLRWYYQLGGPGPKNPVNYGGVDGVHLKIEDVTNPIGGISPINVHDPKTPGRFIKIGRQREAPDYPTGSVEMLQDRGYLPKVYSDLRRKLVSFYGVVGETKDLSSFMTA